MGQRPKPPPGFEDLAGKPERVTVIDPDPSDLDRLLR